MTMLSKVQRRAIRTLATIRDNRAPTGVWELHYGRTWRNGLSEPMKFVPCSNVTKYLPQGTRTNETGLKFYNCETCGVNVHEHVVKRIEHGLTCLCPACIKEFTRNCDQCGETVVYDHELQMTELVKSINGMHMIVCSDCGKAYRTCSTCGDNVDSRTTRNGRCKRCHEEYLQTYKTCTICDSWFHKDMLTDSMCTSCYINNQMVAVRASHVKPKKVIINYGETPARVFLKGYETGSRVFGLEWEGENGYEPCDQLVAVLEDLYQWREIDLKKDASVDKGFEIAVQPCDLEYIRTLLNLPEMMKILKKHGFKSYDCLGRYGKCKAGLHIHINRASFGDSERKKIRAITNFSYMWQRPDFRTRLKTFSRRDDFRYCHFYNEDFTGSRITDGYHAMLDNNKRERNRMLNFWRHKWVGNDYIAIPNTKTIEVRLMRGTMVPSTIYASVELVSLFADIAMEAKNDAEIRKIGWLDVCDKVPSTSVALKNYLKKKHLWEE